MEVKLSELSPGQQGRVRRVSGESLIKRRIYDMGITAGAKVKFVKKAPMGDPIEVNVRGYSLTLRKSEADTVTVILDEETNA